VGGSFFLAITPTYIIVFVCLSATTDGKQKKNRTTQTENQSKNPDPISKGDALDLFFGGSNFRAIVFIA
jgi:hypothetical protein